MTPIAWLPELVVLKNSGHDWNRYIEVLYGYYVQDFINTRPVYKGTKLRVKKHPQLRGKDATFWHIIDGEDKPPVLQRCERIRWPNPIIENCDDSSVNIKIWEKQIKGEKRICIWFEAAEYLVVLAKRKNYILFWTSYPVFRNHRKRKLNKEFNSFVMGDLVPPNDGTVTPSTHGR